MTSSPLDSVAVPSAGMPPSSVPVGSLPRIRLEARKGWQAIDFKELWRYRELAWFLSLRDIKVRYKQTVLGAAWAIIQPLMSMLVFTVFFNRLAGVKGPPGVPYAVSTFCALLPWQLFETSLTQAGNSLVGSSNLISKVYFPRLVVPIASILSGLVDFAIAAGILLVIILGYDLFGGARVVPGWAILTLPLFLLMVLALSLGAGLWLSALNVEYRDVRYVIPFLARLWFFATPVVYLSDIVPVRWRTLYGLNPMVGVVEGFRWAVLGTANPAGPLILVSVLTTIALLIGGLYYFRRMEQTFADVV